jgi:hypothetical protein
MEQNTSWEANMSSASQEILISCGTQMFIIAFISACHLSRSWAISVQSMPPQHAYWRSTSILSYQLHLGLPNDLFPSSLPSKSLYASLLTPIYATCPANLISQTTKLLLTSSSPLPFYLIPLRSKYFSQHSILKHSQPMFLPERFTPTQYNRQNYSSVYLIFLFWGRNLEDKWFCTEW